MREKSLRKENRRLYTVLLTEINRDPFLADKSLVNRLSTANFVFPSNYNTISLVRAFGESFTTFFFDAP